MAHNATLITHAYRKRLGDVDEALKDCNGFVDFIPRFRVVGENLMQGQLREQLTALLELLEKVNVTFDSKVENSRDVMDGNDEDAALILVRHLER